MIRVRIKEYFVPEKMITGQCQRCKGSANILLGRNVQKATILAIPFLKKTVGRYGICQRCDMKYAFDKESYSNLMLAITSEDVWQKESSDYMTKKREKAEKFSQRSNKNIGIAAILALIFGVVGAQNFYMGHKKRGKIALSIFGFAILSVIFLAMILDTSYYNPALIVIPTLCLAGNIYWGLVDCVRILSGYAKDGNGNYIMTKGQHKKRCNIDE